MTGEISLLNLIPTRSDSHPILGMYTDTLVISTQPDRLTQYVYVHETDVFKCVWQQCSIFPGPVPPSVRTSETSISSSFIFTCLISFISPVISVPDHLHSELVWILFFKTHHKPTVFFPSSRVELFRQHTWTCSISTVLLSRLLPDQI